MPLAAGLRPLPGLSPNRLALNGAVGSSVPSSGPALVAHTAVSGVNATTSAINTTGATLLVMGIGGDSQASPAATPADSKGNTWTALTSVVLSTDHIRAQLFYCTSPTVGSGHTFSSSSVNAFPSIAVAAFSGTVGTADMSVGDFGSGGTVRPGSGTPAHANDVVATALATGAAAFTVAIDSGFTITDQLPWVNNVNNGVALAYLIQTSAVAENPAWTAASLQGAAAMASWQ